MAPEARLKFDAEEALVVSFHHLRWAANALSNDPLWRRPLFSYHVFMRGFEVADHLGWLWVPSYLLPSWVASRLHQSIFPV